MDAPPDSLKNGDLLCVNCHKFPTFTQWMDTLLGTSWRRPRETTALMRSSGDELLNMAVSDMNATDLNATDANAADMNAM